MMAVHTLTYITPLTFIIYYSLASVADGALIRGYAFALSASLVTRNAESLV